MNPSQQIIPGPRQPEGRTTGRLNSIELSQAAASAAAFGYANTTEEIRYLALLRRHRDAVAMILGGCLLLSIVYTLLAHKVYRAETVLEVTGINQDFMNSRAVDPTTDQLPVDSYIDTQTRLLKSLPVINRTAELLGPGVPAHIAAGEGFFGRILEWLGMPAVPAPEAGKAIVSKMLSAAKVKEEGASNLITLTVDGPDAQLAADAANAMSNQFIEQGQDVRMSSASSTNRFLTQQLGDARKRLQDSEDALQNYARQTGIVIPNESQESVAADKLRQIQGDLAKAQADEADTQSQLETARRSPADAMPQVLDDPTLRDDRARLSDLRRQLADLGVTLTPANYKVQQLQAQISDLEAQFNHQRANIIRRISVQNQETARRRELLSAAYQQQLGVVSDQSAKEVRYNVLKREVDANRDIYQSMVQRVKEAGVLAALRASAVRVVSPATRPFTPYKPSLPENLILALLGGAALSVCYIMVRERGDQSFRIPGESIRHIDVPELAVIPSAHFKVQERIPLALRYMQATSSAAERNGGGTDGNSTSMSKDMVKWCQEETMMADAYRSAITSILLSRNNGVSPRVILVTSPQPKAGKTTTVANLAISLAEIGRRVLVVDGDLRRPQLGKLFGLQFANGLSDALQSESSGMTLDTTIRGTTVPGLFVLAGGSEPANISQLLHSPRLDTLLESARSKFDFVLIDSPPMIGMADARLLSRAADGVILICRAGQTSKDQLTTARRRLAEDGTPVIGTILNDCDLRTEDPGYYNSYTEYARADRA